MADWLGGWSKRIELSIEDYAGDIGDPVTWFPVTVFLTGSQAEEVFAELTTDAEYLKMQFTETDGTSLLYAEKEMFDVSEEKGIFHVSRDGWTINANTSIFLYYGAGHGDNTDYIGAITARTEVWDGNTEGHWDMAQDPDGDGANAIKDSTSNARHLTPAGSMTTADLVDGKVGKAIDFDGGDVLSRASGDIGITNAYTVTSIVKLDTDINAGIFATSAGNRANEIRFWRFVGNDTINSTSRKFDDSGYLKLYESDEGLSTATWYHISTTWDGTDLHIYFNGLQSTPYNKAVDDSGTMTNTNRLIHIGSTLNVDNLYWNGIIDETIYASVARSPAWMKGLYNSAWDTLFTYGSEESIEVEVNAIFMGCAF